MEKNNKHLEEKPYNLCLNCAHIGKKCDGPNFLAMDITRLAEWCRLRKEYLHSLDYKWTNAYIAEQTGLSKVSVDRFLAGKATDLKASTIAAILKVLVNGSWGQYPCAMGAGAMEKETVYVDNPELVAKCAKLEADIKATQRDAKQKIEYLYDQIKFNEEQIRRKDVLLNERADYLRLKDDYLRLKDRFIRGLVITVAFLVTIIILALIIDKINPNIGFFWLGETLSAVFNNSHTGLVGSDYITGWKM